MEKSMSYLARPEQLLKDHLENVSNLASFYGKKIGFEEECKVSGLLHDLGKYSKNFQDKLIGLYNNTVDHCSQGSSYARNNSLIAFSIHAHHGHSDNYGGLSNQSCLKTAIRKNIYDKTFKLILDIFEKEFGQINVPVLNNNKNLSMATRMITSCLVDADWTDAENSNDKITSDLRKSIGSNKYKLIDVLKEAEKYISKFNIDGINKLRNEFLNECLSNTNIEGDILSITGPTGIGKTVSSFMFALKYAIKNNIEKIIIVVPYTAIIEQSAKVYHSILNDNVQNKNFYILEHHSAYDLDEMIEKRKIVSGNWDTPIILTTDAQFFNTIFGNKPSILRKMHNINNALIVFDECQCFDYNYLEPILNSLKILTKDYNNKIILTSATVPKYKDIEVNEVIKNIEYYRKNLKRVNYIKLNIYDSDDYILDEISKLVIKEENSLIVLNTRNLCFKFYNILKNKTTNKVFHLSNNMCSLHKKKIISEIKERLNNKENIYVVSTQLIEAGVDLDFKSGFRQVAPLECIIQFAGRVNRNLKYGISNCYIFSLFETITGTYSKNASRSKYFLNNPEENLDKYYNTVFNETNLDKYNIIKRQNEWDFLSGEINNPKPFSYINTENIKVIVKYDDEYEKIKQLIKSGEVPRNVNNYIVNLKGDKNDFELINEFYFCDNYNNEFGIIEELK